MSPSRTMAMGPPFDASGATCPAVKPYVAPEKRPSVIRATLANEKFYRDELGIDITNPTPETMDQLRRLK